MAQLVIDFPASRLEEQTTLVFVCPGAVDKFCKFVD